MDIQRRKLPLSNIFQRVVFVIVCLLVVAGGASGCKPKPSGGAGAHGYFKTQFQDEAQFIVEAVVSDLAEQICFAASHQWPDEKYFSVTAREKPGVPLDAPVYDVEVRLDKKNAPVKMELTINGPIWSPAVYQSVAVELARAAGLSASGAGSGEDPKLITKLADSAPDTIERENQSISSALEQNFCDVELHEKAAVLLGAFLLRDHSGDFQEIRGPLSRLATHLAMARYLGGTNSSGLNGRMAEAIMLTLIGNEVQALEKLATVGTNQPGVIPLVRGLQARNTGDYRPLDELGGLTPFECAEWFSARSQYVSVDTSWPKLSESQQQSIDFVRIANQEGFSVEIGHQLLAVSLRLELQEIDTVCKLAKRPTIRRETLVKTLNELPEHCFSRGADGAKHVQVIGWGQWAAFLQRHLCQAVANDYYFMEHQWGVHDDAAEFIAKCRQNFNGLRLYPFVLRFSTTNTPNYRQSVDDAVAATVTTPQLVPSQCWKWLMYGSSDRSIFPHPDSHTYEWYEHSPLPGTAYDVHARFYDPVLKTQADPAVFEKLHELAPYSYDAGNFLAFYKHKNQLTFDQATNLFQAELPYSLPALRKIAATAAGNPNLYEKLMKEAALLDPSCYYSLASFAISHHDEDQAADYYDRAAAADPDSIRVSNMAVWRVRYWIKQGQFAKARKIANDAGEVYSARGLEAAGIYYEAVKDYEAAFEWYVKKEERYDDPGAVINFCLRYKNSTGSTRFDAELQKRSKKLFPEGMKKVTLNDFHGPPADGARLVGQSQLMTMAGLKSGDIIVAVYGIRVHNMREYEYGRELKDTPELALIVWQGDTYREIKTSPPNHRFGVNLADYKQK